MRRRTKHWTIFLFLVGWSVAVLGQATEFIPNPFIPRRLIFPQIANGQFEGGAWKTTLTVSNPTDLDQEGVSISFSTASGQPMDVRLSDGRIVSWLKVRLHPRASAVIQTDGTGPLQVGYAKFNYQRRR